MLAAAFLGGAGTMVIELSAVRLVAPWFGASTVVWTNVIGVVLLALALGYALGARLASKADPLRALRATLAIAAASSAWLPFAAPSVCAFFMPSGVALHDAFRLLEWGSLASTLVLFVPPAACLGTVAPLATEILQRAGSSHAGAAGGRVLAISTIGSLVGTFGSVHVLIPELGIARALITAAVLLALAMFALGVNSEKANVALLALTALGIALSSIERTPASKDGFVLLESSESPYQSIRVVEDRRGAEPLRLLQVNEGLDSFQSVWVPHIGPIGEGYYYDAFALPAWWSNASGRWRTLVLGLGAGTAFRVLEGASPPTAKLEFVGVEIDRRVVEFGRKYFELGDDSPTRRVIEGEDARAALAYVGGSFELVVLDAYAHQIEIPSHLASREFFEAVRAKLVDGGWLAINVGGFGCDDPLVAAVAETVASAFASPVLALRVPASRNVELFARRARELPTPGSPSWNPAGSPFGELLAKSTLPGSTKVYEPSAGRVLTDDQSPIDRLQWQSLEESRARLAALR